MLTPQEVSTRAFTKAVMGGYNMAMVDEFLDELTDDYTALYKENAALKAKMKVLVEKVEDYRATEDSMRATLLTAQKMADSIVREAEVKRDTLMSQVEVDARARITQLQQEAAAAEARLRQGQQELARFIASSRAVIQQQLHLLEQLPELPVEEPVAVPAPAVEEDLRVDEIGQSVMAAFAEEDEGEFEELVEEAAPAPQEEAREEDDFTREVDDFDVTRRINLDDLKFGRNYGRDD